MPRPPDDDRPRRTGRGRVSTKPANAVGPILLAVGAFVLLVGVIVAVWLFAHRNPPRPADFDVDSVTPIRITAAQLAAEYRAESRTADAAYKGKVLEVSGPLNGSSGGTEFLFVTLDGGALPVVCTFDVRRQTAHPDGLGRTTVVRGRCQGMSNGGVSLDLCHSVTPAVKPLTVGAAQLAGEYASDSAAADAKYKGKVVDVTGEVTTVRYEPPSLDVTETLRGEGGTAVECRLMPFNKQAAGRPRFGQTLTVRGDCAGLVGGVVAIDNATAVK